MKAPKVGRAWWESLAPFDQIMFMVCAILILPHVIVLCLFVTFSYVMQWTGLG